MSDKPDIVAITRPIKNLGAYQYESLKRKSHAAAELTRLGVSCSLAEHRRTGKYAKMPDYDKNLKKLDIAQELGTDIRQYTERTNCDAPITAHIVKVANARKRGEPVNSKPPKAAYYPATGVAQFGFPVRASYVLDERRIIVPMTKHERKTLCEKAKTRYKEAKEVSKLGKTEYVDWYVSEYERTHPQATMTALKQAMEVATEQYDASVAIASMKMQAYVRQFVLDHRTVLYVPGNISAYDVRSVRILPSEKARSFKAIYSLSDDCLEKPDEIDGFPPNLATQDTVRAANEALRRYQAKHRNCYRVDAAIDFNVKNLLSVVLIAVYKDKYGNLTGEPFYSVTIDGGWLLSILRLTNKTVGKLNQRISEVRKMTREDWQQNQDASGGKQRYRKQRHLDRLYGKRRAVYAAGKRRASTCVDILVKNLMVILGFANVSRIVVGRNIEQKQESRLHGNVSEHYQQVPYARIRVRIQRWCKILGVGYVETEESYTSKASALDGDVLPVFDVSKQGSYRFSGRRVCRGLYKSGTGVLLNADVNGALNIWRKGTSAREGDEVKRSHGAPIRVTGSAKWLVGVYHPERVSAEPRAHYRSAA